MYTCRICNQEFSSLSNLKKHLSENHCMSHETYLETLLTSSRDLSDYCYRCKKYPSFITPVYHSIGSCPCWKCVESSSDPKKLKKLATTGLLNSLYDYFGDIITDRYLQLFLLDDIYYTNVIPHTYEEFKNILSCLTLPSRNDIWFLDFKPGYSKTISKEFMGNLEIVNLSELFNVHLTPDRICINDKYEIVLSPLVKYDKSHYSRKNLMNLGEKARKTKNLRLDGKDECVKFHPVKGLDSWSSIFQVTDPKTGEVVDITGLQYLDLIIIKLCILRNKPFLRRIFDIYNTILPKVQEVKDHVFLKNRITVNPDNKVSLFLSWLPQSTELGRDEFVTLSIL